MTRTFLTLLVFLAATPAAWAQQVFEIPTDMPSSGVQAPVGSKGDLAGFIDPDSKLSAARAHEILNTKQTGGLTATRSAKDAKLYKKLSPSVVLVVTNDGLGSGTVIDDKGTILTNWHVVAGYEQVGIVFKPKTEGESISTDNVHVAVVKKLDATRDLALLQIQETKVLPKPMPLGDSAAVEVGEDVNAIGHPTGEVWTFTKGIVSQIRGSYEWQTEDALVHQADVIQTQTPINPGNSGGPLLSGQGKLIGVNSFTSEGEGLNFAVSVSEVKAFLSEPSKPTPKPVSASKACDKSKPSWEGRDKTNTADMIEYDLDCDGFGETVLEVPDAKDEPILIFRDRNKDNKPDMVVYDEERDEYWDVSFYDDDFDGKYETEGLHGTGGLEPTSYRPYVTAQN